MTKSLLIAGIDPGVDGYVCILHEHEPMFFKIPYETVPGTKKKNGKKVECNRSVLLINQLAKKLRGIDHIFVEDYVTGMSQANISERIHAHGMLVGACKLAARTSVLKPVEWKKYYGLYKKEKRDSIGMAKDLYPGVSLRPTERSRVDSHDMADALLIAHFGLIHG